MTLQNVEKIKGAADKERAKNVMCKQSPNSYYVTTLQPSRLTGKLTLLTTKTVQNFTSYFERQDTIRIVIFVVINSNFNDKSHSKFCF